MAKTIIHVNQHVIRKNHKEGLRDPVLTVKQGRTNQYAHEATIHGPSQVLYRPDKPLSCGARVWITTEAEVTLQTSPPKKTKPSRKPKRCNKKA